MPIYEYRCASCDQRFEELVAASAAAPPCPGCGATDVTRVYSTFATEWMPSNVAWHRLPGKHDLPGGDTSKPSAFIKDKPSG